MKRESLPAILIGGPPHSGKSVFSQKLKEAIKARWPRLSFYLLRANPDGEGDWFTRTDPIIAQRLRQKKNFSRQFALQLRRAIETRHVPLLVDVGGKITPEQEQIAKACTHAILLSATKEGLEAWRAFAQRMGLRILAELRSDLHGEDRIHSVHPVLIADVAGLSREEANTSRSSPVIDKVAEGIVQLIAHVLIQHFNITLPRNSADISPDMLDVLARQLIEEHEQHAPYRPTINVGPQPQAWEPHMLPALLQSAPRGQPISIYGVAPNWVYGALAAWTVPHPMAQFDAVLGWVQPPTLRFDDEVHPLLSVTQRPLSKNGTWLRVNFAPPYVPISAVEGASVPDVKGGLLVLDGKLSMWMWTALVRRYMHMPRIYLYQPQVKGAVLVHSHIAGDNVGEIYRDIPL